jgi:hypothetical protein
MVAAIRERIDFAVVFVSVLPLGYEQGGDSHKHLFPKGSYSLTQLENTCDVASEQS